MAPAQAATQPVDGAHPADAAAEQMIEQAPNPDLPPATARPVSERRLQDLVREVLHAVIERRATFQWQHLVSETQYRLCGLEVPRDQVNAAETAVLQALARHPDVVPR